MTDGFSLNYSSPAGGSLKWQSDNTAFSGSWAANNFNGNGIDIAQVFNFVNDQTATVNAKLSSLKQAGSSISIADMFEMQMKMNRLSQFSEMASAVVSAASGSITTMARNVK